MKPQPLIVWFRRDLRLADNPALDAARQSGRPVVAVYVLDERDGYCWDSGGASRWWLHHSLASLDRSLRALGGRLVFRRGNTVEQLGDVVTASAAAGLSFSRGAGPEAADLEREVVDRLSARVNLQAFTSHLLHEPGTVRTATGTAYRVFTPFLNACRRLPEPAPPLPRPPAIAFADPLPASERLADWRLTPETPDWAAGLRDTWTPGEDGALERSRAAFGALPAYAAERDRPDRDATSHLSPHLHFGEVSPRSLWHDVRRLCDPSDRGAEAFIRQLYWREFSHHLLDEFPALPLQPLREAFGRFPWQHDRTGLAAWQRGRTGYPIVDAGMRELWHTGWMHNRVRMLAASFLVKHLLIPWQEGAAWFRDTLVDADEANNAASWQWVAGCGTDAAPYFRIFNPVLQGRKLDPAGDYTRRWLPELSTLDAKFLHAPWEAPPQALERAGIRLGASYPRPVVEHAAARTRALDAYRRITAAR